MTKIRKASVKIPKIRDIIKPAIIIWFLMIVLDINGSRTNQLEASKAHQK